MYNTILALCLALKTRRSFSSHRALSSADGFLRFLHELIWADLQLLTPKMRMVCGDATNHGDYIADNPKRRRHKRTEDFEATHLQTHDRMFCPHARAQLALVQSLHR